MIYYHTHNPPFHCDASIFYTIPQTPSQTPFHSIKTAMHESHSSLYLYAPPIAALILILLHGAKTATTSVSPDSAIAIANTTCNPSI